MKRHHIFELKQVLLAFTLLVGMLVTPVASAAGYSGYANITYLEIVGPIFYVRLSQGTAIDPVGCPGFSGYFIFVNEEIDPSMTSYKQLYATVLTAYALNKKIRIYSDSCHFYPRGSRIAFE